MLYRLQSYRVISFNSPTTWLDRVTGESLVDSDGCYLRFPGRKVGVQAARKGLEERSAEFVWPQALFPLDRGGGRTVVPWRC